MVRKVPAMQKKKRKTSGILLVTSVVLIMVIGVRIGSSEMREKLDEYHEKEKILEEQIANEAVRANEIEEYSKYVQTDKFVEEVAKEKLGLVYEDEIVFKKEK